MNLSLSSRRSALAQRIDMAPIKKIITEKVTVVHRESVAKTRIQPQL